MISRKARCHCGQLELDCAGEPVKVALCHCQDCQRRTGSAYGIAAFYERAAVRIIQGVPRSFERGSASGSTVKFHFCSTCGSSVFWEPARQPHLIGVAIGAFADPGFPSPELSVWTKNKHTWVGLPDDIETL